jgi:hypothetical protein
MVLSNICEPREAEIMGDRRKLRNEKLDDFYSS